MKKVLLGVFFATLTCGIGIYLFQNLNSSFEDVSCDECAETHLRPINDIPFAKLYENQEEFEGQIIRVEATLANNDQYISISDNSRQNIIDVGYFALNFCKSCNPAKTKLRRVKNGSIGVVTANSIVVGRLEKNLEDKFSKYVFKILCVEKVW